MRKLKATSSDSKYRIHIKGVTRVGWEEWFDDCVVEQHNGNTIFILPVKDQAALHGFLAKIRDLGWEILQIEKLS